MNDIDALIYVNGLIKDLHDDDFFNEKNDSFMDENVLREEAIVITKKNIIEHGNPDMDSYQFEELIINTKKRIITDTVASLYNKELLEIGGIDKNGDFVYVASDKVLKK